MQTPTALRPSPGRPPDGDNGGCARQLRNPVKNFGPPTSPRLFLEARPTRRSRQPPGPRLERSSSTYRQADLRFYTSSLASRAFGESNYAVTCQTLTSDSLRLTRVSTRSTYRTSLSSQSKHLGPPEMVDPRRATESPTRYSQYALRTRTT